MNINCDYYINLWFFSNWMELICNDIMNGNLSKIVSNISLMNDQESNYLNADITYIIHILMLFYNIILKELK